MPEFHDYLFRQDLGEIEPFISDLIRWEDERQARKLIFIPSQSYVPRAVREALSTRFQNLYAEGYPPTQLLRETEEGLKDIAWHLANYRRYADRRFYKGKEYANILECLAQRKAARLFAPKGISPKEIFVNVQPLSGTPANLAVYWSLMEPGDTFMSLDLFQGGHLSHGSEFNISGKRYRVVSYGVDPETERLDYQRIRELALTHKPKIIVAGYTSYPWAPDWKEFREIADESGSYLMADISHVAGMAAAGVFPNPVGIADIVTFTTHKTLMGPRGAVILTTDEDLAARIDLAIFPGEQGGPHVNKFAAMAVAFELAGTEQFKALQSQIVKNADALATGFSSRGLRLAYGGTDTHLLLLDLKSVPAGPATPTGIKYPLWGEPAVRILDLAGMVANKNTIPGDLETSLATGIRLGTPWLTQRGLNEKDMDLIAGLIHKLLINLQPYAYQGLVGLLPRAKTGQQVLEEVRAEAAGIAAKAGIDFEFESSSYPHYSTDKIQPGLGQRTIQVTGFRAEQFLNQISSANLTALGEGEQSISYIFKPAGQLLGEVRIEKLTPDQRGRDRYRVIPGPESLLEILAWMRDLSDGYILFDETDLYRKIEGPVIVEELDFAPGEYHPSARPGSFAADLYRDNPDLFDLKKPYFVGQNSIPAELPDEGEKPWVWQASETELKRTELYEAHQEAGGKMVPFAGWEMPVRYSSVFEEHRAVRETAGLFDVSHMGVFEISGPQATTFLDTVFSNYVAWLEDGQSLYGYFLTPTGDVIDDGIIYRIRSDHYYLVVNASNEEKDWDWLNAVNQGRVILDKNRPWTRAAAPAVLRNLKDPAAGKDQKRDLALQGPTSLKVLQSLTDDPAIKKKLSRIRRTELISCQLLDIPLVIARTGYTGENWGFEILVHPDQIEKLWKGILKVGKDLGVKPAGLGCRDSTRIEAGLPLYGHELAGPLDISPIEAGFPGYVKYHKPFFVGREALLAKEKDREREIIRFRCTEKRSRKPDQGDPVVNGQGEEIGQVTSCSIGGEGFLIGLAILDKKWTEPGVELKVLSQRGKNLQESLQDDKKVSTQIEILVLPRFPEKGGLLPPWLLSGD
jgi:glycine hydroxymethyltransferase